MTACRCLLLDLGRVLVDIDFRRFGDRMRVLTGLDAEQLRTAMMGDGLAHNYEIGLLEDIQFFREVCMRLNSDIPWDQFVDAWNSIFIETPLVPEGLIAALAKKCSLWVVSNTNRIHFDFISRHYPVLRLFEGFILSYEVGLAKPDPGIFRIALARAGVEAREALFVDDLSANVDAAKGLDIDAFQFLNTDQFLGELRDRKLL